MMWTGNTPAQIAAGRRLLAHYGSWDRISAASRYDHKRGGFVVPLSTIGDKTDD